MEEGFLAFQGVITEIIKKPNENKAEKKIRKLRQYRQTTGGTLSTCGRNMKGVSS